MPAMAKSGYARGRRGTGTPACRRGRPSGGVVGERGKRGSISVIEHKEMAACCALTSKSTVSRT